MYLIDDLEFDAPLSECAACAGWAAPECWHCRAEAKRTSRACELWDELARQRHAREANVEDKRTTDLAKMLSIANRLTALNCDVTSLTLRDDSESLRLLLHRISRAERLAEDIYQHELEVANG